MPRMQARKLPTTHAEAVDFFLETEGGEMEFEAARCRPMLTEDFFAYLKQQIGERSQAPGHVFACNAPHSSHCCSALVPVIEWHQGYSRAFSMRQQGVG